jgi:hypothetical protein
MVHKCLSETVPIHHVLPTILCENIEDESRGTTLYGKEGEMSKSKRFLAILSGDKKLLGMFGGIVLDVAVLVAILVTACIWFLP